MWNIQVSLTPIKDAGGFITNYVAVLQDVTERKSSEAAFKLRDHALSNLSEASAPLGLDIAQSPIACSQMHFCSAQSAFPNSM
jgi:hypothetical protein